MDDADFSKEALHDACELVSKSKHLISILDAFLMSYKLMSIERVLWRLS